MNTTFGGVDTSIELPAQLKGFKEREQRWLWSHLQIKQIPLPNINQTLKSQRTSLLAQAIQSCRDSSATIRAILSDASNMLLPQVAFDWINKKDIRLIAWLFNQFRANNIPVPSLLPPLQDAWDELIYSFDNWNTNAGYKSYFLQDLKARWSQIRTNDEQTRWLDKNNFNQCTWAWKYLYKNMKAYAALNPTTANELHIGVLASLDNMAYSHPAEKTLFINQMKKTWSQKKYRDSDKAKKQVSIPMTPNTKAKLESIATNQGVSIGEALKKIIDNASAMPQHNQQPY